MTGKFIAFEGGEGTGKSTQAKLLAEYLHGRGIACRLTREPGGTEGAEAIRELLLHPPGEGWGARAEALLFAAARSDHVEKLIRPAVQSGEWVISDRYLDSSRAYQGGAGGIGDDHVLALHDIGSDGLKPDLTILIDVPPQQVASRLALRDGDNSDAIGGRSADYHADVTAAFREIVAKEPARFSIVNGEGSVDDVQSRVKAAIAPLFGELA